MIAVRPDLVYGARGLGTAAPAAHQSRCRWPEEDDDREAADDRTFLAAGLLVALLLAGVVSCYASGSPDGLEKVAERQGLRLARREDHALADSPLADYGAKGVDDERLSGGLAGVAGVGVTLLVGGGLFLLIRRRGTDAPSGTDAGAPDAGAPSAPPADRTAGDGGGARAPAVRRAATPRPRACRRTSSSSRPSAFVFVVVSTPREQVWAFAGLRGCCSPASPCAARVPAGRSCGGC